MPENDLELSEATGSSVQIKIPAPVQPSGVAVNYLTSQANQPLTYGNTIYVWKANSNAVPWAVKQDGSTAVAKNSPVSTQKVDFKFEIEQGYIVGYAVGSDPGTVCSTVYIPGASHDDPTTFVTTDTTLSINSVGNNYVQVKLAGLPDYNPAAQGNWVGVWQLDNVPYTGDPMAKTKVGLTSSQGLIFIPDVTLVIGSVYSVGYFVASDKGGRTALAASATFRT